MKLYKKISESRNKQYALLIDPDKYTDDGIGTTIEIANSSKVDFIFLGGSLITTNRLDSLLRIIKNNSQIPVILFPGSMMQINDKADGILLLSLISGRNPDLLIGNHVISAPYLKESGLEIIPTGYMLIENGGTTTVEYISHTTPIPRDKHDIAMCTAMAGEMLGLKVLYLDAGSGARLPVPGGMIRKVRESTNIPLIVGGGIKSPEDATNACKAGADLIVTGNAVEGNNNLIKSICDAVHNS
jgi:putative glycerol-1-phosphate prenyltransferase